ncbi:MAG: GNAT family N-acetyltransferase [Candidatus Sericytochromatia bacterium]|nr:GNAT family N-acetyltransferase [Candidatus Sericytochromatia bacterium]
MNSWTGDEPAALEAWAEVAGRVWRHRPVLPPPDPGRLGATLTRLSNWALPRHFAVPGKAALMAWHLPDGVTGHLGAFEAMPEPEAAGRVLQEALAWLHERGAKVALGPIDGDAWERTRFSLGPEDEPAFLLEPENPPEYPLFWEAAGGSISHRVWTQVQEDPRAAAETLADHVRSVKEAGYRIAPVTGRSWRQDLKDLKALVPEVFAGGLPLAPMAEADFVARFAPFSPLWRSGLSFVARDAGGKAVGFLLGLPDLRPWLGRAGGLAGRLGLAWRITHPRRAVLKTLGVAPAHRRVALGHALAYAFHRRAAALGVPTVLHALMAEGNPSRHMSDKLGARVCRSHALFKWDLR